MIRAFAIAPATTRLIAFAALLIVGSPTDGQTATIVITSFTVAFVVHTSVAEVWVRATRKGGAPEHVGWRPHDGRNDRSFPTIFQPRVVCQLLGISVDGMAATSLPVRRSWLFGWKHSAGTSPAYEISDRDVGEMRVQGEEAFARNLITLEVVSPDGSWHRREIRKENLGMPEKEAKAAAGLPSSFDRLTEQLE